MKVLKNGARGFGRQVLRVTPMSWKEACRWIDEHHRHHSAPRGQKWAVCARDELYTICGVATCGRPVARAYDDGLTIEVNRSCTDGVPNVNSFLYGACWRISRDMGYRTSITYTQEGESGVSLIAAGYGLLRYLPPRPGWADSSVKLKGLRNPVGSGNVGRFLWALSVSTWRDVMLRFNVTDEERLASRRKLIAARTPGQPTSSAV